MASIALFPWDARFETGLPELDAQHRQLAEHINALALRVALRSHNVDLQALLRELER